MSGEHKRPLAAFVVVAVACGVTMVSAAKTSAVEGSPDVAGSSATHAGTFQ